MMYLAEQATTTADWWARGIGAAALLIGVAGLIWTIYQNVWRDRPRLTIIASLHVLGFPGHTLTCVGVEVTNEGRRPTTISWCSFAVGRKQNLSYTPGLSIKDPILGPLVDASFKMPKRLEENESHTFYVPVDAINEAIAENPWMRLEKIIVRKAGKHEKKSRVTRALADYFKPGNNNKEAPVVTEKVTTK